MSDSSARYGRRTVWLWALGLLLLTCCARHSEPTATPPPTPDEVTRYIVATERYTSYGVIGYMDEMSAGDAVRLLSGLQSIQPPADVEALHGQALRGYRQIRDGKTLLLGAGSELRAEAYFMIEWGVRLLLDYRQELDRMRY